MKTIERKVEAFVSALTDVYREEKRRELVCFAAMKFSDNVGEDFTAMLIAMQAIYFRLTGDDSFDIIDFTHILNKLAIQYVMDGGADNG